MRKLLSLPIDWPVLFIPILLTITGIVTIYTITFSQHQASLAISQLIFGLIGLVALSVMMFVDYRFFGSIAGLLFLVGIILLAPLLPQWANKIPFVLKVFGAHRWINLGFFQLQPAEIFKLVAIIFGAKYLSTKIGKLRLRETLVYFILALVSSGLVLAQPDLGTAVVLLTIFLALFLAARPSAKILWLVLIMIVLVAPLLWAGLKPYQRHRLGIFLNPNTDPQGQGYNIKQSLIAVGSGGLLGRGFGQGSQTVLNFLPVAHADFIFAGFAEAAGFVGAFVMVLLYIFLVWRALIIARESTDSFGQLLAIGIAAKFAFQALVHIGMNVGLLPVTGIPLPFMSYGGTALIIDLAAIGLLESVYIRHKKFVFN